MGCGGESVVLCTYTSLMWTDLGTPAAASPGQTGCGYRGPILTGESGCEEGDAGLGGLSQVDLSVSVPRRTLHVPPLYSSRSIGPSTAGTKPNPFTPRHGRTVEKGDPETLASRTRGEKGQRQT